MKSWWWWVFFKIPLGIYIAVIVVLTLFDISGGLAFAALTAPFAIPLLLFAWWACGNVDEIMG